MSTEDVEAIRQCMMSLLADTQYMHRIARKSGRRKGQTESDVLREFEQLSERVNRATRELFYLLPENIRPTAKPRPVAPYERNREGGEESPKRRQPGRKIPREVRWPEWTLELVLALVDEFYAKHGTWPTCKSGHIGNSSSDTWNGIDVALQHGNRGLPGGITLAKLLLDERGRRRKYHLPPLDLEQVLTWADDHFSRTGSWPTVLTGNVTAAPGETWGGINHVLNKGTRGLGAKTSLSRLLAEQRGAPYLLGQERLTIERVLSWADAHHARTGQWPTRESGAVSEAPHEIWKRINDSLIQGCRGLPKDSSIARLLAEHRGVRHRKSAPPLEIEEILSWADKYYERNGKWPTCFSGKIDGMPYEAWHTVDSAFKARRRGLADCGYGSLAHLLMERRGKHRRPGYRPPRQ